MTILTTTTFSAQRQPNGEVWITGRNRPTKRTNNEPLALKDDFMIKVPKEECEALAKLLCPELVKLERPNLNWVT